jgi:hypothetical protein
VDSHDARRTVQALCLKNEKCKNICRVSLRDWLFYRGFYELFPGINGIVTDGSNDMLSKAKERFGGTKCKDTDQLPKYLPHYLTFQTTHGILLLEAR